MWAASKNFYMRGPRYDSVMFESKKVPQYMKLKLLFSVQFADDGELFDFAYLFRIIDILVITTT